MAHNATESLDYHSPQSSTSPSSLYHRDSMSSMSTAPTSYSNHAPMSPAEEGGSLIGAQEGSTKGRGLGERAKGLMGGRFGSSRPPPPSGPPPLLPLPASAQAGPSRPKMFTRSSSRLSTNPLRQAAVQAPAYPPPQSSLPEPPKLSLHVPPNPPPARSASISQSLANTSPDLDNYGRHSRQGSGMSQRSGTSSRSIPSSPTAPPPISPRSSSLSPQQLAAISPRSAHTNPTSHAESSSAAGRRVPSRQLLQNALDLAQRAVEMDQANDFMGALMAYREAVSKLQAVMERVGMEGRDGKKGKSGKAEEEGRTLKGIHDAYVARVTLLESYENGEEPYPDENHLSGFPAPPVSQPSTSSRLPSMSSTAPSTTPSTSLASAASTPVPPRAPVRSSSPNGAGGNDKTPIPFVFPADRTPRPSLDGTMSSEGGHGIGNFMLADQSFELGSPDRPEVDHTPQPSHYDTSQQSRSQDTLTLPTPNHLGDALRPAQPLDYGLTSLNGDSSSTVVLNETSPPPTTMLDKPPPRRESLSSGNVLGLGHPTSPPRFSDEKVPAVPTPASTDAQGTGTPETSRRHRRQMPSVGLEDEAGLTKADGLLDKDEVEEMMDTQESQNGNRVSTHSRAESIDKSLPPIPGEIPIRSSSHSRQSSLSRLGQLISETTSKGTISQRRLSRNPPNVAVVEDGGLPSSSLPSSQSLAFSNRLSGTELPPVAEKAGTVSRTRSKSQPGQRPGDTFQGESVDDVPPLPVLRKKASFPAHPHQRHSRMPSDNLHPPGPGSYRSGSPTSFAGPETSSAMSFSGSLISPVPEIQPEDTLHRPFHLLRTIHLSMDPDGPGAYLTGAIHIPSSVWNSPPASKSSRPGSSSGGGPKINGQDAKVRIMDSMLLHLEIIRHTGAPLLEGPRAVAYGVPGVAAPRIGGQAIAGLGQELLSALDGLEEEMDVAYKGLIKAGVPVGAWKGKKASANTRSWGSKVVRSMDKMTNSKAMDSADKYVDLLASLCSNIQVLNDHLSNFTGPCTPAYHYVAEPGYRAIEQRLHRSVEFVRVVLVPFVLDDFRQFFYRYLKAGLRYIED